tara:strand:- start:92 stop:379 length:288 start_codon:yes stop_codon:yes gene_type:complete
MKYHFNLEEAGYLLLILRRDRKRLAKDSDFPDLNQEVMSLKIEEKLQNGRVKTIESYKQHNDYKEEKAKKAKEEYDKLFREKSTFGGMPELDNRN